MAAYQAISFNPQHVAFGRHETFPLRYGWLTKGFQAFKQNPKIFSDDKATVTLGVGKNMVSAIQYWLQAARLIVLDGDWKTSALGEKIFAEDGWDVYLEDEATLWLIHWLMASNPEKATAIFWFFNRYHKPEFTEAELLSALKNFVSTQVDGNRSESTLKIDANVILRMYAPSLHDKKGLSEEALDSPLSTLNLLRRGENKRFTAPSEVRSVPPAILGFAIAELFHALPDTTGLNVRDLIHSEDIWPAPGAVFRLTEAYLLLLLEELTANYPEFFVLRDTAGIHQVYRQCELDELDPLHFLAQHY